MQCKLPLCYISVFVCVCVCVCVLCLLFILAQISDSVTTQQLSLALSLDSKLSLISIGGLYIVPYTLFNPTPSLNYYTSGAYKCASIIELKPVKTARIQQQLS